LKNILFSSENAYNGVLGIALYVDWNAYRPAFSVRKVYLKDATLTTIYIEELLGQPPNKGNRPTKIIIIIPNALHHLLNVSTTEIHTKFTSICLLIAFLTMPRKIIPDPEFANDPRELCRDQLIKLALEAFNKANGKLSIRKAAL
jgi:hypothetical protein